MSRASSRWGLIGIPDHQGVVRVGGRIGAARGPREFRRTFARLKGPSGLQLADGDAGDAMPPHAIAAVAKLQAACDVTLVVGGGHDHGYTQLAGVAETLKQRNQGARLGCINIDAHLDVRKPPSMDALLSGSPFYAAIETGVLAPERFIEFGIQDHCNSPELWQYAAQRKLEIVPFAKLRDGRAAAAFADCLKRLATTCDAIVVSLDLDAAAEAYAPGVSAPQAEGFTSSEIVRLCEIAGETAQVCSLGIFELNPEHDLSDRTSRLAATGAFHFLRARGF